MTPRDAHERRDDIQLLDVRGPDEWAAGHIDDAMHIPMEQLAERQDEIATDTPIVCVCRSGARSGKVARALARAGYDADNMDGGMQAWRDAGLPFVSEDDTAPRVA